MQAVLELEHVAGGVASSEAILAFLLTQTRTCVGFSNPAHAWLANVGSVAPGPLDEAQVDVIGESIHLQRFRAPPKWQESPIHESKINLICLVVKCSVCLLAANEPAPSQAFLLPLTVWTSILLSTSSRTLHASNRSHEAT